MNKPKTADFDGEEDDIDIVEMTDAMRERAERENASDTDDTSSEEDEDDFDLLGDDEEEESDGDQGLEDDDAGEDEDEEDLDDAGQRQQPSGETAKPKSKAQARIEELAEKRREAERGQMAAEMELLEVQKRLEALEKNAQNAPKAEVLPEPKADDFKYGEVDPDYLEAVVEYRLSKERAQWQEQNRAQTDEQKQKDLVDHYKKQHAKMSEAGEEKYGKEKWAAVDQTPYTPAMARELMDSEQGVDIAYYLANNIDKLRQMTRMTDAQRAKAMGRLEERFSASTSAAKRRSNAPDTPNRNKPAKKKQVDSKYGPENQDEFDKVFWGL